MFKRFTLLVVCVLGASSTVNADCSELLDHRMRLLGTDKEVHLCKAYANKLILIVNTASKCAFTPQYEGLEKLYDTYRDRGLVVLGFPSNDFAGQEPGTEQEISNFCRVTYNVNFPMFEKVHATKEKASPLYQQLAKVSGEYPMWNFHKYLIAPNGTFLKSYTSFTQPDSERLINMIEANLPDQG